jgi:predicted GIY-YIG superfamily endonuclease
MCAIVRCAIAFTPDLIAHRFALSFVMAAPKRFVYILQSLSDPTRYYTGITWNVRMRLADHNARGCRHTQRWTPWRVIVVVAFASERRALEFERYLKSGSGCAFAARHFR